MDEETRVVLELVYMKWDIKPRGEKLLYIVLYGYYSVKLCRIVSILKWNSFFIDIFTTSTTDLDDDEKNSI